MRKRIAVIPGDGIGIDVTAEAVKVLETLLKLRALELVTFDWGAEKYLRTGVTLPEGALESQESEARSQESGVRRQKRRGQSTGIKSQRVGRGATHRGGTTALCLLPTAYVLSSDS
ncbi:MAG: isocitrate/isopropylmalate family dehydrogenase [Terriglobia bacterium]